jgi:hypothetical protein
MVEPELELELEPEPEPEPELEPELGRSVTNRAAARKLRCGRQFWLGKDRTPANWRGWIED